MEGESEKKPAAVPAPSFSGELPIRTCPAQKAQAAPEPVVEDEPEPEKLDKGQLADGEPKDEIELTLKEDGAEQKDDTEIKKKKKKKRSNRSGKKKV